MNNKVNELVEWVAGLEVGNVCNESGGRIGGLCCVGEELAKQILSHPGLYWVDWEHRKMWKSPRIVNLAEELKGEN